VTKVTKRRNYQSNDTLVRELQLITGLKDSGAMLRIEGGEFQSKPCADAVSDSAIQLDRSRLAGQLEFDGDLFAW